ncbi:MAG: hypothetical protein C0599_13705 [Salinivirgaceae bacterium]|nr:MAG: hypothetical protein C0599_13705 [Salinivirgaceae bacterium]
MEKKINTIIADDNKRFLQGLEFILSKMDYKVIETCNDGIDLINSPNLQYADLILTDLEMPHMGGFEAGLRVNYLYPHIPIIALTMHQEKVYLEEIIKSGFKGFIYKPDISKKISQVIDQVFHNEFAFPKKLKLK